ncbi:methyltransferase [Streptomyces ipomoeae]|uniref:Thiopeptide-type bacteriocin biosynthesis domain protein n=2 Tax=Streptomyces ipomoeae TaxID=103232 RepID=L1KUR5_9ACTN|nr:thiopeptide-type bacteriocin biosynthesis protein [Streptomyces ipomoeae]EKX64138.1 thiopeptide-type bacteriocin biosynthesis domain protein [Streptomyces ipomoeae 91-03]MDX2691972.1 thiopeptide-type bacteriocin biosynthesis protein [Streptomyces ipomoeae]MDX2837425.1 thiopeptide-type bacteriocin biosynthesis protein [Streptomyces ipomoeae]TQE36191.1 methyltransferase [Streptomyces ipomoeae]
MNSPTWCQANVAFPDWERAETIAVARLGPLLRTAEDDGALTSWFIIRKRPCWRVRYLPAAGGQDRIGQGLDFLIAEGSITAWTEIIYEPEIHAFGGAGAMTSAHRLFHRDSRSLIDFLRSDAAKHRRETSLLLCSLMMRSAGLDWYEQGDVWARVGAHRALPADTEQGNSDRLLAAVHRLVSVNGEDMMRGGGLLARAAEWASAYADAGRELAHLTDSGQLHRGLREVLAHHVLFAWNRIGLPYATQATLTAAAKTVFFGPDPSTERSTGDRVGTP